MKLAPQEAAFIQGALDSLACKLTEYNHVWSEGERVIYEMASDNLRAGIVWPHKFHVKHRCPTCKTFPSMFLLQNMSNHTPGPWVSRGNLVLFGNESNSSQFAVMIPTSPRTGLYKWITFCVETDVELARKCAALLSGKVVEQGSHEQLIMRSEIWS